MPAFSLVDPAITSCCVFMTILCIPKFSRFPSGLFEIATVSAPFCLANSRTLQVKGVLPLAASPITTSNLFILMFLTCFFASIMSSSAFSTEFTRASFDPAITI